MSDLIQRPVCVLCGEPAITTAAHHPVCREHWKAYEDDARAIDLIAKLCLVRMEYNQDDKVYTFSARDGTPVVQQIAQSRIDDGRELCVSYIKKCNDEPFLKVILALCLEHDAAQKEGL